MTTDGYNNSQRKQKVLERSVDVQQEREKEGEVCASNLISSQARSAKGLKKNCLPNNSDGESSQVHQNSETQDVFGFSGTPDCVKPVPPRAFPDQVYVYFMLEPPPKLWFPRPKISWSSAFNWTWGYRHDADIRTTYFYLEHSKQLPNISFLKDLVQKKEKPAAWFVSNCHEDQAQRLRYVERLKEVLPVDVYGACGTLHCTTLAKECDTMLTKYFFYLSFENSFCQDYVTEKFSRAFLKDVYVVPVVRGGLNYSHHFPQGIFINADDFSSPEELGMYLKKADERRRRLH
ncbi:alpha-(1,3)-fucosyltransferase C-like isoform X3 [Pomacea canaliculata]|uniref:alpha-(1,3)-fucosyltransferase C-like isoform X3 n=1 Tax=Pomacea canaliculata TaxID=400727 RepID=UPI000D72AF13|nr:alpha-(1,3)-fucosyltransferase C-like isoform X3 [Pomacea canaliculata]